MDKFYMFKLLSPACVILFCLAISQADEPSSSTDKFFKSLDRNQDGLLTRDELGEKKKSLFDRLVTLGDKNQDDRLSWEEFQNGLNPASEDSPEIQPRGLARRGERLGFPGPSQMFKRLDRNGDGALTKQEMPEPLRERFTPVFEKLNKDSLNVAEFQTAITSLMDRSGPRAGLPNEDQFFERFDRDQDGRVTLEEIPEPIRERVKPLFDRLGKSAITSEDFARIRGKQPANAQGDPSTMMLPEERRSSQSQPRFFLLLDQDQDGKLSPQELAQTGQLVKQLDRNGDQQLELSELVGNGQRSGRKARGEGAAAADRPRRPEMDSKPGQQLPSVQKISDQDLVERLFERFDRDGDGLVSREEAPDRIQRNFSRLDQNQDDGISSKELAEAFKRRNRD